MNTRIIGIDLGVTASHKAVVLDLASNEFVGSPWSFEPTVPAMERLLKRARHGATGEVQLIALLEATGMAWYPVGVYLHDHGVTVYRVNGRQTRDLRHVYARHAASDRIDARVLAHLYQVAHDKLLPWSPPSGDQLALQRVCREFARWREQNVAIQNRLTTYDQWAWRGLTHLIPACALPWVRQAWYNPWQVQAAGVPALCAAWQAANPGEPVEVDWIPRWVQRAQEMCAFWSSECVGYPLLQASIQRDLDLLAQSRAMQAQLSEQLILPLYRHLYPEGYLESIHGIGAVSAAIYMAFILDIQRFPTIAQFRAWCGIVPASKQSGFTEAKGLHLTQAGANLIKATLYQNANVARQWDLQLAALYYRQMVDFGKHHTQAVCACASHLANRIYTLLKQQRPYQLRDLHGQPISPLAARRIIRTQFRVPDQIRRRNLVHAQREARQQRVEQHFVQILDI